MYYEYRVPENLIEWNELKSKCFADEIECIAEDAAEHYHDCCDGWQSVWPLIFEIREIGAKELLARVEVAREPMTRFYAIKVEDPL